MAFLNKYRCHYCGKWVKDKFIIGTFHFCLSKQERNKINARDRIWANRGKY